MLIDRFAKNWFEELYARTDELRPSHGLYLLIDGVFVPGLHRSVRKSAKALLFESLPGCSEAAKDVSPFLIPFDSVDKNLPALLRRCEGWPMVSAIETPESLAELSERLAAWCVVEAAGQPFNFRFPDTRRLPGVFQTLSAAQRAQMAGPAARWSYVSRDGNWSELEVDGLGVEIATEPVLDERQFAILVDDSRTDELLMLLADRGCDVYQHPSKSHAQLTIALRAAAGGDLGNEDTVDWCEWSWRNDQLQGDSQARLAIAKERDS